MLAETRCRITHRPRGRPHSDGGRRHPPLAAAERDLDQRAARAGVLGLSSTLLPCGWLYAFAAFAAGSGSAASGAFVMSAFWLGSLPVMLGVGFSLQSLTAGFKSQLPRLRALLVLSVGVFTLLTRIQIPAFASDGLAVNAPAAGQPPMSADCPFHKKGALP